MLNNDDARSPYASLPIPKNLVRRTEAGAGLRLNLDDLRAQVPDIPEGKKGRVEVGYDHADGVVRVGAATLTKQGWTVDLAVGVAVRQGFALRVLGGITF